MAEAVRQSGTLTLESTLESVETLEAIAEEYALSAGFGEEMSSHLAMVVREAAVNAAMHGNGFSPEKRIRANFELDAKALTITIADEGNGLDLGTVKDPLAAENLLRTSGRGIFLMKALMDEVHFRKLTLGTEITMVKHRIQKETEA